MASRDVSRSGQGRRLTTETKHASKTTEFWAFVVVAIAVLIAADNLGGGQSHDVFRADKAWLYVTILTVGYVISRGLAKAGSREPYNDVTAGPDSGGITQRLTKAAAVLRDGDLPADTGTSASGPGETVRARDYPTR